MLHDPYTATVVQAVRLECACGLDLVLEQTEYPSLIFTYMIQDREGWLRWLVPEAEVLF